jgi:hypothetical protein
MSTSRDLSSYKKTHNLFIDHVSLMVWLEAVDYLELTHLHPKGLDKLGSEASLLCLCVCVCVCVYASPLCPDRRSDVNQGCKPSLHCLNNSIRSSTFICRNNRFRFLQFHAFPDHNGDVMSIRQHVHMFHLRNYSTNSDEILWWCSYQKVAGDFKLGACRPVATLHIHETQNFSHRCYQK